MARSRTLYLPLMIAAAVAAACAVAFSAVSEKAEATLPGKTGRIAYSAFDVGAAEAIYTIKAGGGGKTQVTNNDNTDDLHPVYSPDGKKIAYTVYKGDTLNGDVYTINVGGGGKFRVTHGKANEGGPAWGSRP